MNTDRTLRVRKRDGSLEPFNPAKLVHCLRAGLAASADVAGLDTICLRGLAEVVEQYVIEIHGSTPVSTVRLAEWVDTVLSQTGHDEAATTIRRYAQERERLRRRVLVATARSQDGRLVHRRWNKGHLVQHLRRKHLLDAPASRMIAGRVEQLIFGCGLRIVTSGLVAEMTRSELMAWGLLPAALATKLPNGSRRSRRVQGNADRA